MTDANISIGIDSRGAVTGAREVRRSLSDIESAAGKTVGAFDRMRDRIFNLRNAFLGLGAGLIAKSFLDVARETENLEVRLKFLTGSAQLAARAFRDIRDFAATVPFTFQEIQAASANLLVATKGPEELNKLLRITGDIAASTGLSFQQTAEQLQRAMTAGIASADMFREKGVAALLGFQQGVTVSADETRKRILGLWDDATFRLVGASQEMAETWDGMVSMLQDKWFAFRSVLMDSGPFQVLKAAVKDIDRQFQESGDSVQDFAERLGVAIAQMLTDVVSYTAGAVDRVAPLFSGLWDLISTMWTSWEKLANTIGVPPEMGLLAAIVLGPAASVAVVGTIAAVDSTIGYIEEAYLRMEGFVKGKSIDEMRDIDAARREQSRIQFPETGAPEETGTGNALRSISEAMQGAIDKFKEGTKVSEELEEGITGAANATGELSKEQKKAQDALNSFIRDMEAENRVLRAQIAGKEELVPLIEAEARLRERMGRELLPKERDRVREIVEENRKLSEAWERQREAAKEYERIWEHAAENVQDALGDSFRDMLDGNIDSLKDFGKSVVNIIKDMAAEAAAAWAMNFLRGGAGSGGGFSIPGINGMIGGGVGPSAGGGLFSSIGNMFSAPGGFGGIGDFFGGLFGGGSGGFTQLASGRVAREGLASAATGAGGLGGGLSGAMAAIPVWGWIAGAATLAKSFVEGSDRGSPQGALNTLLGPSLEEWQNDFGRSWAITVDPVGVALGDLGLPSWMTAGGLLADVFGKKPSEGETFEARFERSGAIRNVGVDNGASMATARQMADQFSAVMQAALGLTGGQFSQSWRVSRSARSGLRLDVGGGWQQFANEPDLIQQLLGASGGDPALRNALRRSQATDMQGFATDIQALTAIQDLVANDNMTELQRAIKQVNDQFEELIEKSRELGYGTADLVRIRNEEVASVREQFKEQERLAKEQERLAKERERIAAQQRQLNELDIEGQILERLGQAGAQITSFISAYQLSGQSSLNPMQRLSLAEQEFETLLEAVQGGNLGAIGALNQSASTFLGFARQQFASSSGFTDVETRVFEALRGVRSDILSEQNINDTLQSELELTRLSQVEVGERLEAAIREEIQALRQDINQLRISGEAA